MECCADRFEQRGAVGQLRHALLGVALVARQRIGADGELFTVADIDLVERLAQFAVAGVELGNHRPDAAFGCLQRRNPRHGVAVVFVELVQRRGRILQRLEPRLRLDDVLGQGFEAVGDAAAGGVALLLDLRQRAIELDLPFAQLIEHRRDGPPCFGDLAELLAQGLLPAPDLCEPLVEIGGAAAATMGRGQKLRFGHPLVQRQQRIVGIGRDHMLDGGVQVTLRFFGTHRGVDHAVTAVSEKRERPAVAFGARRLPDHRDHQVKRHQRDGGDHRLLRVRQRHERGRRLVPVGLQGLIDQNHRDGQQHGQGNQRQPHGRSSRGRFRRLQSFVADARLAKNRPAGFSARELVGSRNSAARAPLEAQAGMAN